MDIGPYLQHRADIFKVWGAWLPSLTFGVAQYDGLSISGMVARTERLGV